MKIKLSENRGRATDKKKKRKEEEKRGDGKITHAQTQNAVIDSSATGERRPATGGRSESTS